VRRALVLLLLWLAFGCGVKAPPQPPGVPPAQRGGPIRLCPGCEIPRPDSVPSPSTEGDVGEGPGDEPASEGEGVEEGAAPEGPETHEIPPPEGED